LSAIGSSLKGFGARRRRHVPQRTGGASLRVHVYVETEVVDRLGHVAGLTLDVVHAGPL
jgi:hypothetical protein